MTEKNRAEQYSAALKEIGILAGVFGPITVLYEVGTKNSFITGHKGYDLAIWFVGGLAIFHAGMYLPNMHAWLERKIK